METWDGGQGGGWDREGVQAIGLQTRLRCFEDRSGTCRNMGRQTVGVTPKGEEEGNRSIVGGDKAHQGRQ